jgi:GxxExxY protein
VPFDQTNSPETFGIIGAAIEVQRLLGTNLLESAYGDALEYEFEERGIPFQREVGLDIHHKRRILRTKYRADFVCHGTVLVELKSAVGLGAHDFAQVWHYLALTGKTTGLLLNFGRAPLQVRRFVNGASEVVSADFAAAPASGAGGSNELA